MTVGTTFPRKILNNGKEPCEPLIYEGPFVLPSVVFLIAEIDKKQHRIIGKVET